MITTIAEAQAVLDQNENFMVCMEMDGRCWIREGVRDKTGVLVADGRFVAQIAEPVFETITPGMDIKYCSEYFQRSELNP